MHGVAPPNHQASKRGVIEGEHGSPWRGGDLATLLAIAECELDAIGKTLIHLEQLLARPGANRVIGLSILRQLRAPLPRIAHSMPHEPETRLTESTARIRLNHGGALLQLGRTLLEFPRGFM
jgi:hypothetical protein